MEYCLNYCLNKEDFEDIRILIAITESIFESYNKLIELEANGKKDTLEFQKIVEALKSSIQMEPVVYERIGNSFPKVNEFMEYFKKTESNSLIRSNFELVITGNKRALILGRITNRLVSSFSIKRELNAMLESEKIDKNSLPDEALVFLQTFTSQFSNNLDLTETFKNDDFACFLGIIQRIIDSPFQKSIRSKIVSAKYYLSFTQEEIEKNMLDKNFEVESQVYLRAPFLGELQKQEQLFIKKLRSKIAVNLVLKQTKILLEKYDDSTFKDDFFRGSAVLRTCVLRTGLLSLNDDEILELNELFHEQIEDDNYLRLHPDNSEVEELIANAYRQVKKDKTIPIIVSMKQKKY